MRLLAVISFLFLVIHVQSQLTLQGKITDEQSGEALSYVNIGVIDENIGTVTTRDGRFSLEIPEAHYSSMMRISFIGYESIEIEADEVEKLLRSQGNIDLKPTHYKMEEVIISDTKLQSKVVGNRKWRENVSAAFHGENLGKEMGIIIKLKKRRTIVKDVSFVMSKNDNDTVRYRLNVYTLKNGKPHENVLKENVIIEAYKGDEVVTADLEQYNIIVEDDFFIALEWIEDYPEESIYFAASLFSKPVLSRETSQASWVKIPFLGIGLYATVLY